MHGVHCSIGINYTILQGIHCIQSVSVAACCMDSTACNLDTLPHAACNPLHSLWMYFTTLHAIHCIHSGCISQRCMESSAFNHSACNSVHQSRPIGPWCMESTAFNQDPLGQAACNPLHSLGMHFTLLHGIQCIQSHCMESTSFNRYQLHQAAWKPLQ